MAVFGVRFSPIAVKATSDDRKLKSHLSSKYANLTDDSDCEVPCSTPLTLSLSFPSSLPSSLPLSLPFLLHPLPHSQSQGHPRKLLLYLISTLNNAFPDHDFSDVRPEYFSRVPSVGVCFATLERVLASLSQSSRHGRIDVMTAIVKGVDELVELSSEDTEVYSFNPAPSLDPNVDSENGGSLWSFYYFFVNRKQKRLVFFWAKGVSCLMSSDEELDLDMDLDDGMSQASVSSIDSKVSESSRDGFPCGLFRERHRSFPHE